LGFASERRQVPEPGLEHERLLVTLPMQLEEVDHLGHDPAASEERNEVDPRAWLADVLAPPAYGSLRHRFAGRQLQGGGEWTSMLGRAWARRRALPTLA
jgi:hypothetical protein